MGWGPMQLRFPISIKLCSLGGMLAQDHQTPLQKDFMAGCSYHLGTGQVA